MAVAIHPLVSPWGRFGLYNYFIDAPEPAVVDTGISSSPREGIAPALERIGRRIEDVRWILLTHGHIDHLGGAAALRELTGGRARVVIHEADAHLLRFRRAHAEEYAAGRGRYLRDPEGVAQQVRTADAVIAGPLEPDVILRGGENLPLGDGAAVRVHHLPGHTAGSVGYESEGALFVGDAVQVHGAANGFPGYEDPVAYRASLERVRDEIRPHRMFLGHPYRSEQGVPFGLELDRAQAQQAVRESLEAEARIRAAVDEVLRDGVRESDSPYSPFERVAQALGYAGDPTLEPSPFFTTLGGYRDRFERDAEGGRPRG